MFHLSLGAALVFAGVSAVGYALILSTSWGRRWAVALTWTTVVLGDALTLFWLATFDQQAAIKALMFFAVTGTPIIIRSLVLDFQERESVRNHEE
jgi:hypothetical protein